MGANASRVRTLLDVAAAVLLRDIDDGAETSTATETPVSLNELDTAYWHGGEIPHGFIQVQVQVTAVDATTGDETYVITLQVDDTADHSNSPVTVATQAIANTFTGVFTMLVDAKNIPGFDTDSSGSDKWIAIKATLGGTTPSITYGAHMVRSIRF